jgi:predicted nucleic acid-binding protein
MAGGDRVFVDTNVLLYAHDTAELEKNPIARSTINALWSERTGTLSTQVLQEFYNAATRKLAVPLGRTEAREIVDIYSAWHVVVLGPALILSATRVEEDYGLSFWDALIVEAARTAGARRLLTEDLQHGRVIAGVEIENPFRAASGAPGA